MTKLSLACDIKNKNLKQKNKNDELSR